MTTEAQQQIISEALDNAITALGQCQKGTARQFLRSAMKRVMVHRCPDCGSWITRPTAQRKGDAAQPQRSEQQEEQEDIDLGRVPPDLGCQHSEQQEWTVDSNNVWLPERNGFVCTNERYAKFAADAHNAALVAERQRREQAESVSAMWNNKFNESQKQLLSAQAAVEKQTEALCKCLLETRDNARLQNIIATALSVSGLRTRKITGTAT